MVRGSHHGLSLLEQKAMGHPIHQLAGKLLMQHEWDTTCHIPHLSLFYGDFWPSPKNARVRSSEDVWTLKSSKSNGLGVPCSNVQQPMMRFKTKQEGMQNNAKTIQFKLGTNFVIHECVSIQSKIIYPTIEYPICPMIFRQKSHEPCWLRTGILHILLHGFSLSTRIDMNRGFHLSIADCSQSHEIPCSSNVYRFIDLWKSRFIEFIVDFPICSTIFP